jgi:hypothetical protein
MRLAIKTGLAFALCLAAVAAPAQDRSTDPLQGLTRCFTTGEFHVMGSYRLSPSLVSRRVDTVTGPANVSIEDGYRLMIYRSTTAPLVNLLIERSVAGQFASDRAAIGQQMAALADGSRPPQVLRVESSTQNGIDILAIHKPALETPGVVSTIQLFDATSGTRATADFLNQQGPAREFNSDAQHAALRERFVGVLSACMARQR